MPPTKAEDMPLSHEKGALTNGASKRKLSTEGGTWSEGASLVGYKQTKMILDNTTTTTEQCPNNGEDCISIH